MLRTLVDAAIDLLPRQPTERLGDARYPIIFLSGKAETGVEVRPVLVNVAGGYFESFVPNAGQLDGELGHMIARAQKTLLPQIGDFMGRVVIVDRHSTVADGEVMYVRKFESAPDAVKFFREAESARLVRSADAVKQVVPPGPGGAP